LCDDLGRMRLTLLRPSSCGSCAGDRRPVGDAGGSAERPVEREMGGAAKRRLGHLSGTGSERAKIASVAVAEAPREPGSTVAI
jgi:hypothetical protein